MAADARPGDSVTDYRPSRSAGPRNPSHLFLQISAAAGALGSADLAQETPQHPPRLLQSRYRRGAHSPDPQCAEHPGVFHPVGDLSRVPASRARPASQQALPSARTAVPPSPRIARVDSQESVPAARTPEAGEAGGNAERAGSGAAVLGSAGVLAG